MQINAKQLQYLKARAQSLCGNVIVRDASGALVSQPLAPHVVKFFDDLLTSNTPEATAQRNAFLARCKSDPAAAQSLAAIRVETFNNFIYASTNIWDMFFETVNLLPDEAPYHQNTTNEELRVYYVGGDGSPRSRLITRDDQETRIPLDFLSTDWARYQLVDVYRGQVADAALAVINLAYDWKNQADGKCFELINSANVFGAFAFTGKKQNYPYVTNSRVNTANLPATNDIDISSYSASPSVAATPFGFPVLDEVINYYSRWAGVQALESAQPTGRILVPGKDVRQIQGSLTASGAKVNTTGEKILEDGWFGTHYLGKEWTFIPDNTLAPGTCYPEATIKPGQVYLKPSLDEELVASKGAANAPKLQENQDAKKIKKIFAAALNGAKRRHLCRVTYDVIAD